MCGVGQADAQRLSLSAQQGSREGVGRRVGELGEDLVGHVVFQAPDDVAVGQSLGSAAGEVGHGAGLAESHAYQHDPMQGMVGLAVPAPIK